MRQEWTGELLRTLAHRGVAEPVLNLPKEPPLSTTSLE